MPQEGHHGLNQRDRDDDDRPHRPTSAPDPAAGAAARAPRPHNGRCSGCRWAPSPVPWFPPVFPGGRCPGPGDACGVPVRSSPSPVPVTPADTSSVLVVGRSWVPTATLPAADAPPPLGVSLSGRSTTCSTPICGSPRHRSSNSPTPTTSDCSVVSRLAQRQNVRVSLQPSAYGGTTAVVIPDVLLTDDVPDTNGAGFRLDRSRRAEDSEPEDSRRLALSRVPVQLPGLPASLLNGPVELEACSTWTPSTTTQARRRGTRTRSAAACSATADPGPPKDERPGRRRESPPTATGIGKGNGPDLDTDGPDPDPRGRAGAPVPPPRRERPSWSARTDVPSVTGARRERPDRTQRRLSPPARNRNRRPRCRPADAAGSPPRTGIRDQPAGRNRHPCRPPAGRGVPPRIGARADDRPANRAPRGSARDDGPPAPAAGRPSGRLRTPHGHAARPPRALRGGPGHGKLRQRPAGQGRRPGRHRGLRCPQAGTAGQPRPPAQAERATTERGEIPARRTKDAEDVRQPHGLAPARLAAWPRGEARGRRRLRRGSEHHQGTTRNDQERLRGRSMTAPARDRPRRQRQGGAQLAPRRPGGPRSPVSERPSSSPATASPRGPPGADPRGQRASGRRRLRVPQPRQGGGPSFRGRQCPPDHRRTRRGVPVRHGRRGRQLPRRSRRRRLGRRAGHLAE
ncbi:hypothetical protein SHIRM173S_04635 [Streptomyces hirsutus]